MALTRCYWHCIKRNLFAKGCKVLINRIYIYTHKHSITNLICFNVHAYVKNHLKELFHQSVVLAQDGIKFTLTVLLWMQNSASGIDDDDNTHFWNCQLLQFVNKPNKLIASTDSFVTVFKITIRIAIQQGINYASFGEI